MLEPRKLFGNFFNDERITPLQLHNFAEDVLLCLKKANATGDFTALINLLMFSLDDFHSGLSRIANAAMPHNNEIKSLDDLAHHFKTNMAEMQYYIADAVGSFKSVVYKAFYPNGINEYKTATKTQVAFLMKRVSIQAQTYKPRLGNELSEQLCLFEKQWQEAVQLLTGDKNSYHMPEREALESTLLTIMHAIGQKFPGNILMCMSFFNFSLLFYQTIPKK